MRDASAPPFRQALETRLGSVSRAGGGSLVRLRKEVVFDRLLARLVAVAPDRWILKGALALDYRFGDHARTTRDDTWWRSTMSSMSLSGCWRPPAPRPRRTRT